ncbi:YlcI/YnfO family protein [Vermiculatibacterium agrestimuris]|uniref:YlcI/YnfO family protein n=1 Tax=Vermiculatibacterium agrestimuris TaxID=2941519 RepID=UPI002041DB43|nr:YlcI/YnfO family protein [Vermiculatibacterium agrestimuris]
MIHIKPSFSYYGCNAYLYHKLQYITSYKCVAGDDMVRKRKFKIPAIPPTTSKCVRFPNDIIEKVEEAIRGKDCTFSAFVIEATRLALLDLEEEEAADQTE